MKNLPWDDGASFLILVVATLKSGGEICFCLTALRLVRST
jgi:hypothetical protein